MLSVKSGCNLGKQPPVWPWIINRRSMQANGLISLWAFHARQNSGSGAASTTLPDYSGRMNHLTFSNLPYGNLKIIPTRERIVSPAMLFNGSSHIAYNQTSSYAPTQFSISSWVYMTGGTSGTNGRSVFMGPNTNGLAILSTTRRLTVFADAALRQANTALALSTWYHVACTSDGTTYRWYVNGIADGTYTMTTPVAFPEQATAGIGGASGASKYFGGRILEVRVYDRVLRSDDIWRMYAPSTRWELYYQPRRKVWFTSAAAPPAPTNQGATLPMMGV